MTMPFLAVLTAFKAEVETAVEGMTFPVHVIGPDRQSDGFEEREVRVRHYRGRASAIEEWPCVAIRFVSNDPNDQEAEDMDVQVWELAVDLVIDTSISAEERPSDLDDSAPGVIEQLAQPTGLEGPAAILAAILKRICGVNEDGEFNSIDGTVWSTRYDGSSPDDDEIQPDQVRLSERLALKYRARRDDPTVLLPS